ncbi:hypothetical protein PISMIDRAFT_672636 [Pisolithus microcarpus 441]|uniref:RING-type domain-containing protein n=1 Tax=Pisolithus microcarpus 441 TaxID=765257 RepID=A0A0C9ZIW6_9AGAM|nr:hypothetical protein BKA83DRAFT_672636 [Pisolithus microcarpus]KIK29216.1 hypothetical protein PISMIDRAFT_672636 [Pisolithus microcarpus 441]
MHRARSTTHCSGKRPSYVGGRDGVEALEDTSRNGGSQRRRRSLSPLSPVSDKFVGEAPASRAVKKPKRAETRLCPVCSEQIPVRLLEAHAVLELQRVDEIVRHIGDAEPLPEADVLVLEVSSNKIRRSALKARQSLTALQPAPRLISSRSHHSITTPVAVERTIAHITRRRRARQTRLRELAREEAAYLAREDIGCPVCGQNVRGDRDVVEAHVDACLAYESRRAEIEQRREILQGTQVSEDLEVEVDDDGGPDNDGNGDGSVRTRVITAASLRGTGIQVCKQTQDTEEDIDIDGTDDAAFGGAQFGEADVVGLTEDGFDEVHMIRQDGECSNHNRQGLQGLTRSSTSIKSRTPPRSDSRLGSTTPTSESSMDELDLAVLAARSRGDHLALITALEAKINSTPPAPTCRVCLSQYTDPTVSTGCWHICCATCWLRCLGATKLCPMCLRITSASELRRIYL